MCRGIGIARQPGRSSGPHTSPLDAKKPQRAYGRCNSSTHTRAAGPGQRPSSAAAGRSPRAKGHHTLLVVAKTSCVTLLKKGQLNASGAQGHQTRPADRRSSKNRLPLLALAFLPRFFPFQEQRSTPISTLEHTTRNIPTAQSS